MPCAAIGADEGGLVDTSVWIDFFNGRDTPETTRLGRLIGKQPVLIGES